MLKITYYEKPFYCNGIGIDHPCTKDLSIEFDQDASATEILNEIVKLLKYAGYSFIDSKKYFLEAIDDMVWDGTLKDDTKESQEN